MGLRSAVAPLGWLDSGPRLQLRNAKCPFLRFVGGGDHPGVMARWKEGVPELPASHRVKAASAAGLEQFRVAGSDRYTNARSVIMVVGLSVHTAPVELREKLALGEAEWAQGITELCRHHHLEEAAVLSTCNRMEVYVVALSWHRGLVEVLDWMSKRSGISVAELREHLFILRDQDACEHLFRVSGGLDSLVVGEEQILGQVKQVLQVGEACVGFGRHLSGLFKHGVTAGKRVGSETSIAAGAVSVSSAAVELVVAKLSKQALAHASVLIVGAGKMSRLLIKHLRSKGCTRMVVVNRSEQKVLALQTEFADVQLLHRPLTDLMACASEAELIFTSTSSQTPLFERKDVEGLPATTRGTRYLVDIAVPRNVGACVAQIPGVTLYNVDDLAEVVAGNQEDRRRKGQEAQAVIDAEVQSFMSWRDSLQTVPTIKKLRAYAENIRSSELQKCVAKLSPDMSPKDRKLVEELTRGIVNKLLHGPMQHLRSDASDGRSVSDTIENMHALERMFDLKANFSSIEQQLRSQLHLHPPSQ